LQSDYKKRAAQEGADIDALNKELSVRLDDLVLKKQKEASRELTASRLRLGSEPEPLEAHFYMAEEWEAA
jgi:hypothetical protein